MSHTNGTYMAVARGPYDGIIAQHLVLLSYGSFHQRHPARLYRLEQPFLLLSCRRDCYRGCRSTHDSPDARVASVGGLVGALELGHLVRGIDKATVTSMVKKSAWGCLATRCTQGSRSGAGRGGRVIGHAVGAPRPGVGGERTPW